MAKVGPGERQPSGEELPRKAGRKVGVVSMRMAWKWVSTASIGWKTFPLHAAPTGFNPGTPKCPQSANSDPFPQNQE